MSDVWANESEPIHLWFSLTRANYLILPRSVLQSMPVDWQREFCRLLTEARRSFGHLEWPDYAVNARGADGRFKLDTIPHAGRRLGIAQARAMVRGRDHPEFIAAVADTIAFADTISQSDPVAGRVILEAAYKTLHADDEVIDGTAHDVVLSALDGPSA